MKRALILVDLQYDFLPGGALAVPHADQAIDHIKNVILDPPNYDLIVATQDWHPHNHESFASQHSHRKPFDVIDLHGVQQVLWPDHCVQNTHGAELVAGIPEICDVIIQKGHHKAIDSYSGFFDNDKRHQTELDSILKDNNVSHVDICGLALDYCVKYTAIDAAIVGYHTRVLVYGCRGISDLTSTFAQLIAHAVELV